MQWAIAFVKILHKHEQPVSAQFIRDGNIIDKQTAKAALLYAHRTDMILISPEGMIHLTPYGRQIAEG